jgi:cell division topological specificity factor
MQIDQDKVNVKMERGEKMSTLAVDVELPFDAAKAAVAKKKAA